MCLKMDRGWKLELYKKNSIIKINTRIPQIICTYYQTENIRAYEKLWISKHKLP